MPKRSNKFQRLVNRIEKTLAGENSSVTESALITDEKGVEREIDILVQGEINGHSIKIAIECRDHHRNQHVEWLDSLVGKYVDLKLHKVIAVSSTNFSPNARKKADGHNIELITFGDSQSKEWLDKLRFSVSDMRLTLLEPIKTTEWTEWSLLANSQRYKLGELSSAGAVIVEGENVFTIAVFGDHLIREITEWMKTNSSALADEAMQSYNDYIQAGNDVDLGSTGTFSATKKKKIDRPKGLSSIRHADGSLTPIDGAVGSLIAEVGIARRTMKPKKYGSNIVNHQDIGLHGITFDLLHIQDSERLDKSSSSFIISTKKGDQRIQVGGKTGRSVEISNFFDSKKQSKDST